MAWFVFCTLPVLIHFPLKIVFFGIAIVFGVQILVRLTGEGKAREKRFEIPTLKKLLPIYIIYLLLLAVWPTTIAAGEWQHNIIFEQLAFQERIVVTFRFVEFIAAFTLLGYIITEMSGRKNESLEKTLDWIVCITLITLVCSLVIAAFRDYSPLISLNILEI